MGAPPGQFSWNSAPAGSQHRAGQPGFQSSQFGGGLETLGKGYSGSTKEPKTMTREDELMEMLRAFFEEMNAPFDPNSPEAQLILKNMEANARQSAGNSGIFGGYSNNLAQQAYGKGVAGLAMQKKGMAANALGMLTGATQNQRDFDYSKDMDLWNIEQQNSPGAQIGAGIGGVAGGIAGFFGGDAAGGAQAGMNIGRGIGQGFSYTPPPGGRRPGGF